MNVIRKILCLLGIHKSNIVDLKYSNFTQMHHIAFLECQYCGKESTSTKAEDTVKADAQKQLFEKELKLKRRVLIEKVPRDVLAIYRFVNERRKELNRQLNQI